MPINDRAYPPDMRHSRKTSSRDAAKRTRLIVGNAAHDVYQTVPDDASGADRHLSGKQNRRKTTLKNSRRGGLAERAYDHLKQLQIGRASLRERVCQYV